LAVKGFFSKGRNWELHKIAGRSKLEACYWLAIINDSRYMLRDSQTFAPFCVVVTAAKALNL